MINGKTVLAVIPARGGSKGVFKKNIRPVGGKPLIAWSIEAASASKYIDRLILSSDDEDIIDVALAWGCEVPFVRPRALARDDTPGVLPLLHSLREVPGYDYVCLLQPTSPLRTHIDIDGCLELCQTVGAPACVSVVEVDHSPYWMYTLSDQNTIVPLLSSNCRPTRRQDSPPIYRLNGAVYVAEAPWIQGAETFLVAETVAYPMPRERSLDIDTEDDFRVADYFMGQS